MVVQWCLALFIMYQLQPGKPVYPYSSEISATVPLAGMVVYAYRPVIVLHGIFASQDSMAGFVQFIQTAHPGTQVLNVDAYDDLVRQCS